jgi:predicted dehydrogenase
MLADPEVEAVLVCSSTDTHAYIAIEAAQAGKHIFCEKPVDLTPEKVNAVIDAVEKAGCKIVESDVRQIATMKKELTEEEEEKMQNFLDRMDENDDVQNVWHNADM